MRVRELLRDKGYTVHSIGVDRPVLEALAFFNRFRIGALIVNNAAGEIAGIVTERDVLRRLHTGRGVLGEVAVGEIMTPRARLIVAVESDDIDYVMSTMTSNRIRHVPVVGGGEVKGVLSVGDLIRALLSDKEHENKLLQDYIAGQYPA